MTFRLLLAALAAASVTSAACAQVAASPVSQTSSFDGQQIIARTTIPMADLDLGSPTGLRTLLDRIEAAADLVCGGPQQASAEVDCRARAVREAVVRAGSPAFSDLAAREARRP